MPQLIDVLDWENPNSCNPRVAPQGWFPDYTPIDQLPPGREPAVRCSAPGEPVRAGQRSVRFELHRGDNGAPHGGSTRAELEHQRFDDLGKERWYGFSIFLPSSWERDAQSAESLTQWHQASPNYGPNPPLAILTRDGQWRILQAWDGNGEGAGTPIGKYQTDRWTDWVVHVKWSEGDDGRLTIWKDGEPVPQFNNKTGKNTYRRDTGGPHNYMKFGIYKWDWAKSDKENPSNTRTRVMFYDELRIADETGSYDQVAPGSRSTPGSLSLVGELSLSPSVPTSGEEVTAKFVVANTGGEELTVGALVAGARDPGSANVDFPAVERTLKADEVFTYQLSRSFASPGPHVAWPAADLGGNWVELGPRIGFDVRPGPFGPGNWPPASWRPYGDSSPFNTPIPEDPQIHPNSAGIVARILGDISRRDEPSNLIAHLDGSSGEPTYYARPSDPEYTLRCTMTQWGDCPLDGHRVRIPIGAQVEGNRAARETNSDAYMNEPDAHLTVVDQGTGWEYDLWQVHRNPVRPEDGLELRFSWGGRTRIDGDGVAAEGNATAAHFGSLAGRLRAEELEAGEIRHALSVVLDCDSGEIVYPAKGHGRRCANTVDAPPMGARLQLYMSLAEIDALPVPAWKKTLLRAMATYGMFFMDTGTDYYFTIEQEAGNQYQSLGYPDKWVAVAEGLGWSYFAGDSSYPHPNWTGTMRRYDDGIDWTSQVWSRLRLVVTPPPNP